MQASPTPPCSNGLPQVQDSRLGYPALEALAAADIRQMIVDPLRYGTLKEVGLAALCEITELRSEHFAIGGQPVPFSGTPLPYGIMAYAPAQLVCRNQHREPWRDRGE